MNFTFDIIEVQSCLPTYSWDEGNPGNETSVVSPKTNLENVEYVGYAPFVSILLSSTPGINTKRASIKRIVDFGDYYNTETNIVRNITYDDAYFTHNYIMPGTYTIAIEQTEYQQILALDYQNYGVCFQKYSVDWTWRNFNTTLNNNDANLLEFTWKNTKSGGTYEKKWRLELPSNFSSLERGIYTQKTPVNERDKLRLSWQWYNFVSDPANISVFRNNTATTWLSTGFQQSTELNWNQTAGPCINTNYLESDIVWTWDNIRTNPISRFGEDLTWDQTRLKEAGSATWDFVSLNCYGNITGTVLSASSFTKTKQAVIRVLEIPPVAYIKAVDPIDQYADVKSQASPLTVRLTARFSTTGSFPIERIDWDLGDGSPILTQRRWSPTLKSPFVFSGQIEADYEDPRNYDIIHTYTRTSKTGFSFYPSITAYASSTGSYDSAACIIGPLKYPDSTNINFVLLQNELTEHGKILIGQINDNTVVWRADK